jgi:hypothetical protein
MDLAFLALTLIVLAIVLRYLRFDDTRWMYNAWTYFLLVPTVTIAMSMLLRVTAGRFVERSMQISFLMSVLIHLLLLVGAINMVVFARFWPDIFESMQQDEAIQRKVVPEFFTPQTTSQTATPEYMLPVPTTVEASPVETTKNAQPLMSAIAPADTPVPLPQPQSLSEPFLEPRKTPSPSQPSIASASEKLQRQSPKLNFPENKSVDLPDRDPFALKEPSPLDAPAEMDAKPVRSADASLMPTTAIDALASSLAAAPGPSTNAMDVDRRESLPSMPDLRASASQVPKQQRDFEFQTPKNPVPLAANELIARASPVPRPIEAADVQQTKSKPRRLESVDPAWASESPAAADMAKDPAVVSTPEVERAVSGLPDIVIAKSERPRRPREAPSTQLSGGSQRAPTPLANRLPASRPDGAPGALESKVDAVRARRSPDDTLGSLETPMPDIHDPVGASLVGESVSAAIDRSQPALSEQLAMDLQKNTVHQSLPRVREEASETIPGSSNSPQAPVLPNPSNQTEAGEGRGEPRENQVASGARRRSADGSPPALKGLLEDTNLNSSPWAQALAMRVDVKTEGLDRAPREIPQPNIANADLPTQRFRLNDVGGPTMPGSGIPKPTPAFQKRLDRAKQLSQTGNSALGPETEAAIERGLEFLAAHQRPDGSWRLEDLDTKVKLRSHTAATGLAILAFQGAGYTHQQGRYATHVRKALEYMISQQRPNGDLYARMDSVSDLNAWLYSHGIGALALCEAYGMTQDPALREPAQSAIRFVSESQDPKGGGWRYAPKTDSDTSVSGWCMMALKSAQLAGLEVDPKTFLGIRKLLDFNQGGPKAEHLFRYKYNAPDTDQQRHGRVPNPTMTSVGLLMKLYLGSSRNDTLMRQGAEYLLKTPPENGTARQPKRDTYYWYYATQVLFHMGGDTWKRWDGALRPLLIQSQVRSGPTAGSWEPLGETPDAWGEYGGRLYVTTMNLLSLEVNYRHLPLYEATAK